MWTRRSFLRVAGIAPGAAFALRRAGIQEIRAATAAVAAREPQNVAADESYWREIQFAFSLDRTLINLNNGNQCPAPTVVHDACKRYMDWANQAPAYHRALIEKNIETARRRLGAEFGADPDEIAITRNASESLQIAQNGLDLKPGDEVITTEQDYGRMLTTWDQRARRDKIKVTRLDFPCPTTQADLLQRFETAITPQTRVLHFCHITNQSGQLFPVRDLALMARRRGIISIVDGAHAMGHFPYQLRDLAMRWANELKKNPRIRLHSSLEPGQTWGLAVVSIDGIDSDKLVTHLWDKYRIVVTAVGHNNPRDSKLSYRGLRVTPNIYTPLEEIDTFVEAMQNVLKNGLG